MSETGRLKTAVKALPIPETGPVLFVLNVSDEALYADGGEGVVVQMHELAQQVAGERAHVAVLTAGLTLDVLTDEQLKPLGLQRIPVTAPVQIQLDPAPDLAAVQRAREEGFAAGVHHGRRRR